MISLSKHVAAAALLAGLVAQCVLPASAQSMGPNERFANQQQRIHQGEASGQLTHHEARRDERHLHAIERRTRFERAVNGGHLTRAEYARTQQRLNNNSARIYNTKHNGRHQPGAPTL